METENPSACYEFAPIDNFSATLEISIDPVFPNVIHFSNLTCAHEIVLYNAILILLLRLGDEVLDQPSIIPSRQPRYLGFAPMTLSYSQEKHAICKK